MSVNGSARWCDRSRRMDQSASDPDVEQILNGWCTYFRVGNSCIRWTGPFGASCSCGFGVSRVSLADCQETMGVSFLHERCRLYPMMGKVSHLEGLRRKATEEDDRRAGCGKTACPVR
jgi:hypothetical protein